MEKISIILPIYNVDKYLATCLESLLVQTHKEIEMILVNDGSKDNSLEICKEYAEKDSRIIIINKENEGVAIARNIGLEVATGKYVAFVDPDDWVEPLMYESLLKQIKKWDAPICLCNFYRDTKRRSQPKHFEFNEEVLIEDAIIEKLLNDMIGISDLLPKHNMIMGSVWRGIYERSFLEQHGIKFVPNLTIMEDLVFMVQALLKCTKVAIDQGIWYHYVQHPHSALHSYNQKLWEDQLLVYKHLEKSLIEANLEQEMRNRLDIRYIGMVLSAIKNETYVKKDGDFRESILRIRDIFSDDTLKMVLERVKPIQVERSLERNIKVKDREDVGQYSSQGEKKKEKTPITSLYKERLDRYNE